jgi:hypothetical protein
MLTTVERTASALRTGIERIIRNQPSSRSEQLKDALITEHEREKHAQRSALVKERADLTAKEIAAIDAHAPRMTAAQRDAEQCRAALDASLSMVAALEAEHRSQTWPLQHRRQKVENELYELASPLIRELRESLRGHIENTQAQRDSVLDKNIAGRMVVLWSNQESVRIRIEAIFALGSQMANWHLEGLSDSEVTARFEARIAELPPVEGRPAEYTQEQ